MFSISLSLSAALVRTALFPGTRIVYTRNSLYGGFKAFGLGLDSFPFLSFGDFILPFFQRCDAVTITIIPYGAEENFVRKGIKSTAHYIAARISSSYTSKSCYCMHHSGTADMQIILQSH